ncbi:MAG: hypothetical protein Kow0077_27680 [Anaerolineae bacterium]
MPEFTRPRLLGGGLLVAALLSALAAALFLPTASAPRIDLNLPAQRPLVLFLAPASSTPHNLFAILPEPDARPIPITASTTDVLDYAPAPDGTRIVYSEALPEGGTALRLLDLTTGQLSTPVTCPDAECTAPAWHPDGTRLAYERTPLEPQDAAIRPTQVYLLDLSQQTPKDAPLFADESTVTTRPRWSPDGALLAVYDAQNQGILLHNPLTGETGFLPARHGTTGAFSPDGTRLVIPEIDFVSETTFYTHLRLVDLATSTVTLIDPPDSAVDDDRAIWMPDGTRLIVSRRYMDSRHTTGRQLYLVAPETGDTKPLVVDPAYYTGLFALDPAGEQLVIQRLPAPGDPSATPAPPELWIYDLASGELTQLVTDGFVPAWLP